MSDDRSYKSVDKMWLPPHYEGATTGTEDGEGRLLQDDLYLRRWSISFGRASVDKTDPAGSMGFAKPSDISKGTNQFTISSQTPGMDFRVTFKTRHADVDTPPNAEIRIYNLSNKTANGIIREFNTVEFYAGYIHGHYGKIFSGTIKQYKRGRESAVDSYLDIFASDGDFSFNWENANKPYEKGQTFDEWRDAIAKGRTQHEGTIGPMAGMGGILPSPRGGVMWGTWADQGREHSRTTGTVWSMQNGVLKNVKSTAYAPGDEVIINSNTGMVGIPEVTSEGIFVTTLLNPNYFVTQRIHIDNRELNRYFAPGTDPDKQNEDVMTTYGHYKQGPTLYANINTDGIYKIVVIDHEGDTRGMPWYSQLTCLTVDPSAKTDTSVAGGASYPGAEGEGGDDFGGGGDPGLGGGSDPPTRRGRADSFNNSIISRYRRGKY